MSKYLKGITDTDEIFNIRITNAVTVWVCKSPICIQCSFLINSICIYMKREGTCPDFGVEIYRYPAILNVIKGSLYGHVECYSLQIVIPKTELMQGHVIVHIVTTWK